MSVCALRQAAGLRPVAALVAAAVLGAASPAWGATGADQAAAEALFVEAKKLMEAGNYAAACPKLAESQRLDAGAGTALNLGDCYEHVGKLASAWAAFHEAGDMARAAGEAARQAEAARRAEALAPRLPKLAIVVPPANWVPGLEVLRDGSLVGEGQYGSPIPADPGEHLIAVSAPGRKTWTTVVTLAPSASITTEVPPLARGEDASTGAGSTLPFWRPQRVVGLTLGVVGVVGFGIAAGFGVNAATKNTQSLLHCLPTDQTKCDQTGVNLRNQAYSASYVSTGLAVGGGALLTAGVIVFLTTPRGAPPKASGSTAQATVEPIVGPGLGGLALRGRW